MPRITTMSVTRTSSCQGPLLDMDVENPLVGECGDRHGQPGRPLLAADKRRRQHDRRHFGPIPVEYPETTLQRFFGLDPYLLVTINRLSGMMEPNYTTLHDPPRVDDLQWHILCINLPGTRLFSQEPI